MTIYLTNKKRVVAKQNRFDWTIGQEKRIFFLGAQPGDKNFLQTNGVFFPTPMEKKSSDGSK
jgi:hypothetical protein